MLFSYIKMYYAVINDSPLAHKENISPEDLWDKPLIISRQAFHSLELQEFLQCETDKWKKYQILTKAAQNILY